MTYNPRIITPGKMIITPGGKIARCPGFQYEFSVNTCCCFLDPSPSAWVGDTEYAHYAAVSHSGSTWYSTLVGINIGNEPGVAAGWDTYTHCDNENWDSIPPFGGMGKIPKYYAVSYEKSLQSWSLLHDIDNHPCPEIGSCTLTGKSSFFVIVEIVPRCQSTSPKVLEENYKSEFHVSGSYTSGGVTYDEPYGGEYPLTEDWNSLSANLIIGDITRPRLAIGAPSTWNPVLTYGESSMLQYICGYPASRPVNGEVIYLSDDADEDCILQGSASKITQSVSRFSSIYSVCFPVWGDKIIGTHDETITISWRPLDCDYEPWDIENWNHYKTDDCVVWKGKFYKKCTTNVSYPMEPEADATNICEIGYAWRLA